MPNGSRSANVQAALVQSASRFAHDAVKAYLDDAYEVFLIHAATASEHLLKASLCARSVALIAEATANQERHFRSLVALLDIDMSAPATEPDRDEDRADPRSGELGHDPLVAVALRLRALQ